MTVLAEHGLTAEQAGMFTAAGLDTTQLLQWFLAFASSGKIPQLIQLIMQVIAIVKPNLPPTPVPPAPTPTSEQEA